MLSDDIDISLQDAAFERLLQQEQQRMKREDSRRMEANNSDDITPWIQFMQWDKTFRGKDRAVRKT